MPRATFNGAVIAESQDTVVVEGNHYFPRESVSTENVSASGKTSICPWKGTASYLDVEAGGETAPAAAWFYPDPKPEAAHFKDYVAFWGGVKVEA